VEINNKGTRNRVTADAVKFVDDSTKATILVDNDEAGRPGKLEGVQRRKFCRLQQDGQEHLLRRQLAQGELFLRYKPSIKTNAWREDGFYQVQVGYPAKKDHEIRTPVIVKGAEILARSSRLHLPLELESTR
jgi:hypothetical protein